MHDDLQKLINKNLCHAALLGHFYTYLPNFPSQDNRLTEIDNFTNLISRYTRRAMYFAQNFLNNVSGIIKDIESKRRIEDPLFFVVHTSDSPYFDFDAFIFSTKSIVEENIVKRGENFHPEIRKEFETFSKGVFKSFIKDYLNPIRNEVVHLEKHGSSEGSVLRFNNGLYQFVAFDYTEQSDLMTVFKKILTEISIIIFHICAFIMRNECTPWGFPNKDIDYTFAKHSVKISDFVSIVKQEI